MNLALNTLMWCGEPFEDVIGYAHRLGVANLDLGALPGACHLRLVTAEEMAWSCAALKDALPADMRVLAVTADHPGLSAEDEAARTEGIDYTVASMRAAEVLGAPVVGTSLGNVGAGRSWAEAAERAVESLTQVMAFAPPGVRLAVEVHVDDVCNSLEKTEAILSPVGHDRLGVIFDTSLLFHNRIPLDEAFERLGHRLFHVHLRGATADTYFAIPGRDEVDFPRFFRHLADSGYDGAVSLELYEVEARYGISTLAALEETLRYLDRAVGVTP